MTPNSREPSACLTGPRPAGPTMISKATTAVSIRFKPRSSGSSCVISTVNDERRAAAVRYHQLLLSVLTTVVTPSEPETSRAVVSPLRRFGPINATHWRRFSRRTRFPPACITPYLFTFKTATSTGATPKEASPSLKRPPSRHCPFRCSPAPRLLSSRLEWPRQFGPTLACRPADRHADETPVIDGGSQPA